MVGTLYKQTAPRSVVVQALIHFLFSFVSLFSQTRSSLVSLYLGV